MCEDVGASCIVALSVCVLAVLSWNSNLFYFFIIYQKRGPGVNVCLGAFWRKLEYSWISACCGNFMCKERVVKRVFHTFYLSNVLDSLLLCLGQNMHPCIPLCPSFFHPSPPLFLLQQGTDERSKVSPVEEAAFCRSHASASLHTYTHTQNTPYPRREHETQLGAITGAVHAHTHIYTWTHPQPFSWWESSRVTLSHLWPFLRPSQSSSAHT